MVQIRLPYHKFYQSTEYERQKAKENEANQLVDRHGVNSFVNDRRKEEINDRMGIMNKDAEDLQIGLNQLKASSLHQYMAFPDKQAIAMNGLLEYLLGFHLFISHC